MGTVKLVIGISILVGLRPVVGPLGPEVVALIIGVTHRFAGRITDLRGSVEVVVGVAGSGTAFTPVWLVHALVGCERVLYRGFDPIAVR